MVFFCFVGLLLTKWLKQLHSNFSEYKTKNEKHTTFMNLHKINHNF